MALRNVVALVVCASVLSAVSACTAAPAGPAGPAAKQAGLDERGEHR